MDKRIVKTLNHIEAHLSHIFNLKELASIACLSASQYHRLFKKETGKTPFQFCQEIKLQYAYDSLTNGRNKSIQDLSDQLGYKDYETFSRAFKKQFIFAPADLKSIADRILNNQGSGLIEGMFLASFDNNDLTEDNIKDLKKMVFDHNISKDDLMQAHVYTISKKQDKSLEKNVIKNKFELVKSQKIWKKLMTGA